MERLWALRRGAGLLIHDAGSDALLLRSAAVSSLARPLTYALGPPTTCCHLLSPCAHHLLPQLCNFPNSKIWKEIADDEHAQYVSNPGLHSYYAVAGFPELPVRDAERCDWVVGDVAGPWRMRILAKCTGNMVVFNECASDDTPHGHWVNICSAVVSPDGKRMEGMWMQTRDGRVIVSPSNSGTFEAVLFESPPEGIDHVEWYYAKRDEQRKAWAGRLEGGLPYDDNQGVFEAEETDEEPSDLG